MKRFSFQASIQWGKLSFSVGCKRCDAARTSPSADHSPVLDFFAFAHQEVQRAARLKSPSTIKNYQTAVAELQRFVGLRPLPFAEVNVALMYEFEHWLRQRGLTLNTSSCYMRSLRSIYNQAVDQELTSPANPFRHVFTGREKTRKRAAGLADIQLLHEAKLKRASRLELTRDLFLFSFYACGMPFIDMAFLCRDQLHDGYLEYSRHKTGQRVCFKLLPCMQQIIDRYAVADSPLVFPILRGVPEEQYYDVYQHQIRLYNRRLHMLEERLGTQAPLTSYVARHTWATLARESNVEVPVISKGLGHTNVSTTQIYMRDVNDSRLDEANQKLMAYVFGSPV